MNYSELFKNHVKEFVRIEELLKKSLKTLIFQKEKFEKSKKKFDCKCVNDKKEAQNFYSPRVHRLPLLNLSNFQISKSLKKNKIRRNFEL